MSLYIDPRTVVAVLIAGTWMDVTPGSFDLDAYEYGWERKREKGEPSGYTNLLMGGQEPLVPATGFEFTATDGSLILGPITSIQAIRQESK